MNFRKSIRHEIIQRYGVRERKRTVYKFFFSVFEKRRIAIIRLIRLVSEGDLNLTKSDSTIVDRKGVCICG